MEEIQALVSLLQSGKTAKEIQDDIGPLLKVVGEIHVIKPFSEAIENIGLVTNNEKVQSINLKLRKSISFVEIKNRLSSNYSCLYNHYDEQTVLNFQYNDEIILHITQDGYINEYDLPNKSFNLFEIEVK